MKRMKLSFFEPWAWHKRTKEMHKFYTLIKAKKKELEK